MSASDVYREVSDQIKQYERFTVHTGLGQNPAGVELKVHEDTNDLSNDYEDG